MNKTKIKKLLITIGALALAISTNASITHAEYDPVPRDTCTLVVKPFDATKSATTGAAGDQYINYLNNCGNFITYPNPYSPQPPQKNSNPLKNNAEGKHLPITRHNHIYYNDTVHDDYYYKAFMDRFEITLESDGFSSINLNNIECQTPHPTGYDTSKLSALQDCSGTLSDLWGGTTLTKQTIGNNIRITWNFGQTNQNGTFIGQPVVWANNGSNFKVNGPDEPGVSFVSEDKRKLEFNVHLPSKNNNEIWSATTSSRVLLADLAIKKTNYNNNWDTGCSNNNVNNSNSGWCYLAPPAGYTTETVFTTTNRTFYWFPVGSVATVWREPEPEIPNVCTGLDAILTDETVTINNETAHKLEFNNITFSQSIPVGLLLKWTSDDPNGTFWVDADNGGYLEIGTGTTTTHLNETEIYYIGEGPVHVKPNLPDAKVPNICKLTFEIIPEEVEQVCGDLLVDHNSQIYTDTLSYFNSIAKDTENQPFPGNIKYEVSVDEDYGTFYTVKPAGIPDNTSLIIYETNALLNIINSIELPLFQPAAGMILNFGLSPDISPFSLKPRNFGFASILALAIDLDELGVIQPDLQPDILGAPGLGNLPFDIFELKSVTVGQDEPVYFHAKKPGTNVIEVKPITTNAPACFRKFSIVESPKVCASLNLTSDPVDPFDIGEPAMLSINPLDQFDKPLPGNTKFKLTTTAGGKFTTSQALETVIDLGNSATFDQFPIQFEDSNQDGAITVEIDPNDPAYSAVCKEELDVGLGFNCLECNFDLHEFPPPPLNEPENELKKETLYTITANAVYSEAVENTITYKLDQDYGTFVKSPLWIVNLIIPGLKTNHDITPGTMAAQFGAVALANELVVEEDELVIFVTYSNAPEVTKPDALQIQATGFFNEACHKKVGFSVGAAQCNSLSVAPIYGKFKPDEDKFTIFNVSGDFKNHPGEIEVNLSGPGTLSKIGVEDEGTKTLTYSNPDIENSNNNLAFSYERSEPFDKDSNIEITVKAIGPLTAACEDKVTFGGAQDLEACLSLEITKPDRPWEIDDNDDEQIFQIKVQTDPPGLENQLYYNWKVDDGDGEWEDDDDFISKPGDQSQILEDFEAGTTVRVWASEEINGPVLNTCEDYIKAKSDDDDEEGPKITKYIFPENDLEDLDDLINIGETTPYVTYLIKFESGDQIKSTKIWESSFNYGKIISNQLGGSFDFKAMRINVIDNGQHYTILQTQNYTDDNVNSNLSDKNFLENGNGEDIDAYQEDYMCSEDNDELCIVGNFDLVVSEFKKGNPIEFQNIKDDTTIYIKYQMTNESKIDEDTCKDLTSVCGEEFNNKINFVAYENEDFTGKDYQDYDKARAIVICPYILTREGGDVFFHDVIDTGIDVAQCSEVKGHQGPGITPTPVPIAGVPRTGAGDIPSEIKLSLTLPSHDICKYSNLGSNIEGYNDVLKHFSSTICELRADVAKEWTESHINKSIEANITRIARFGENIGNSMTIQNVTQLNNLENAQSGVFISNSNLTIGSPGNDFVIKASENIPAAQTYIVRGDKNLYINSNIRYADTDYKDPKSIATAAFIVIDGNIVIDQSVTHIDGILMAIDTNNSGDGKITQNDPTTNRLTINGSLIGNVYDLFANRTGVGDPKKDQGSVTIHYDERILLNTPPGISELIDVQQTIVPN